MSALEEENGDGEPIHLTNDGENAGLPVIEEVTYSDLWSKSKSTGETKTHQTLSEETSEAPQAITFQQVMMMELVPNHTTTTTRTPVAMTMVGPSAPHVPASGPLFGSTQPRTTFKATMQQQVGTGLPGSSPPGLPTPTTTTVNITGVATMQPPISAYAMNYLTMPIPGDDLASRTLEALRLSQLNAQLAL